jgi:hypothetical protein
MPQRDLDRVCNDASVGLSEPDGGLTLLPAEDGVVVGGRAAGGARGVIPDPCSSIARRFFSPPVTHRQDTHRGRCNAGDVITVGQ